MYKVLYVEDEVFLAKIVSESLERNGHEVRHLLSGRLLQKEFQSFKPDICILDIMLPDKNGYEIAEEIRLMNIQVPIIFLSAKSQTQDLVAGFKSGGNDYMKKPFSIEELLVRMDNLIQLTKQNPIKTNTTDAITLGKLSQFYPHKQLLLCNGKEIQLSYKESSIIELLCKRINGATERKEILLKVWDDDSYFNSRNLDVYIRKLRSYLKEDENLKIITLKGVGYHFVVE